MKKQLLLLVFTLILSNSSFAQYTLDWMNDVGEYNKTGTTIAIDDSNNVVVSGHWLHSNIYTRKYSSTGTLLWETSDTSGIQSNYQKPMWSNCDSAGNTYVVGKRYVYSSSGIQEYADAIVVLKYNPSGVLLWKRNLQVTITTVVQAPRFQLRSEVDEEGNLYIGTSVLLPATGLTLTKLSPTGETLFQTTNNSNSGYGFGTMRLKNGKIYMTGKGDTIHGTPLVVWDTSGNLIFSAGFVHPNNLTANVNDGYGFDLEVDDDGNAYLLSNTNHTSTVQTNNNDILVQKVSPNGSLVWQHNYDFGGNDFAIRFSLGGNRINIISYFSGFNLFDWRTLQIDIDGNLLWDAIYDAGTNDEIPYWVTSTSTGEPIVTGKGGPSPDPNQSYVQMVILKYTNTGVQEWISTPNIYGGSGILCKIANDNSLFALSEHNMTVYHYNSTTLANTEIPNDNLFSVAPNPFENTINVQLNDATKATVFDMTGKSLLNFDLNVENNAMDLSGLKSGIYFCTFASNNGTKTIKLVKK